MHFWLNYNEITKFSRNVEYTNDTELKRRTIRNILKLQFF